MVKKFLTLQSIIQFYNCNDKHNFLHAFGIFVIPSVLNQERIPLLSAVVFACYIAMIGYVNFKNTKKIVQTFPISKKMQIFNMYMSGIIFLFLIYMLIISILCMVMLAISIAYIPTNTSLGFGPGITVDSELLKNIAITACMFVVYFSSVYYFHKFDNRPNKAVYYTIVIGTFVFLGFIIRTISLPFVYGLIVLAILSMFLFPYLSYKTSDHV